MRCLKFFCLLLTGLSGLIKSQNITNSPTQIYCIDTNCTDVVNTTYYLRTADNVNTDIDTMENYFKFFRLDVIDDYDLAIYSYTGMFGLFSGIVILTCINGDIFKFFNKTVDLKIGYYSYGSIIFISIYLAWWIGLLIYSFLPNDKLEIMARLGVWITLNLSTVFLPITRNSIWVIFFNISQERIIYIHRIIATLCIISVFIKFIAVLILYPTSFLIKLINPATGGSPLFGTLATIMFFLCGIFSIKILRQKYFELFYYSHKLLSVLILVFSTLHYMSFLYYILPSIILYFIDLILRNLYMSSSIYSKIQNMGDEKYNTSCSMVNITLKKDIKVFPGCYFYVCFYKDISKFQWHPLSMVSYNRKNNDIVFCLKNMGDHSWSGRLYNMNKINSNILSNRKVLIQGPYGHISVNYRLNKYSNITIICGGIGVTPMISILKDISNIYKKNRLNKLKKVNFIWLIPHISLFIPFKKYLIGLNDKIFDIKIYVTRKDVTDESYYEYTVNETMDEIYLNLSIVNDKPDITHLLNMVYLEYKIMTILLCGNSRLTTEIIKFSNDNNIDISNEVFS